MSHTPTPWTLNKYGELVDATGENIKAKGFALTGSEEARSNTAFIFTAVNSHDALARVAEIAERICRKLEAPDQSVTIIDQSELRNALAALEEAK